MTNDQFELHCMYKYEKVKTNSRIPLFNSDSSIKQELILITNQNRKEKHI